MLPFTPSDGHNLQKKNTYVLIIPLLSVLSSPTPILCGEIPARTGKEKTTPCVVKSEAMTSDLPNIIAVDWEALQS